MIRYSPYIEGVLPAFSSLNDIKIPFEMNPAVGKQEVKGFAVKIKPTNAAKIGQEVYYVSTTGISGQHNTGLVEKALREGIVDFTNGSFPWNGGTITLNYGDYYKFQLAYFDDDIVANSDNLLNFLPDLTYSTVGVARYIKTPDVKIDGLNSGDVNKISYTGKYITETISEPVYSYRFLLTLQTTGEIIDDTGEVLYNSYNDNISNKQRTCVMQYFCNKELTKNVKYVLEFSITTVNGYQVSKRYQIIGDSFENGSFNKIKLEASNNRENGFITIKMQPGVENTSPPLGSYTLFRKSSLHGFELLENLIDFSITTQAIDADWEAYEWRDLTVQYGTTYQYVLRPFTYNNGLRNYGSGVAVSNSVTAVFDDLFIVDAKRQLAVRFDPKVSSFKEVLQENKVETLGSKYPFFFRNGHLKYKEIPISGLISYLTDDEELELFIPKLELGLNQNNIPTTNLVDYNIIAERTFREVVLEWLNNGQPKLFRSPTEGNCVIRLMNVSLSPNDTLGRMLYSFSTTGYEVADNDYKTLYDLKLADCVIEGKKNRGYFQ